MIALMVTPPIEEKGVEMDGAEEVGGVANLDCLEQNYVLLRLTVVASIAPIMWKWLNKGKGTEKWCKILVIAEELVSASSSSSSSSKSLSSSDASGGGEGDSIKPPRRACHLAIRPTRVFT